MDKEEENKYVSQLQEVFSSCDTTGTGYLDKDELTDLCHKLHLDAQLPLLLQTLLGNDQFARVNFDEFKEGFVAVLSSTIDISISEDDDESSYLEPDEVKPKFVKGTKKYGRRTRPEREDVENEANKHLQETHQGKKKNSLRRSSSLESVESLKSDEEAEIVKEPEIENFEAEGQLRTWNTGIYERPRRTSDMTENQVRDIWEELGVGHNGYLNRQELTTVCKNIGLEDLSEEELEDLFNKLDRDGDDRVSFSEFQMGFFSHTPIASTPLKHHRPWPLYQPEDSSHKTTSFLSGFGGIHVFSSIDDGSGFGNPEQIIILWEEEGIEDGKEIFMSLDISPEQRVNLLDLSTALENELIATKNRIHLAALASYKHELLHQHNQIEQISKERDKAKRDLRRAERRNSLLVDEVDDHNSAMESLNESKIKDLDHEYRQRLSSMRTELEDEKEQFLQQNDQQKKKLETDLANYQTEQEFLKHKLELSVKENSRLQKEMMEVVGKLSESESQVIKLQSSLDQMLQDKKLFDPCNAELYTQEEKFAEIIREYEVQCRELRDRNDELQIQLETLRSQLSENKYSRLLAKMKDNKLLHHKAKEKIHHSHTDTPAKKGLTSRLSRSMSAAGSNGSSLVQSKASSMTMEDELAKHQVKELQQEIEDLKIQLETKVNYYEREVELMKANFEKERKDTEHSFKLEISELEEQKADLEELNSKYQEVIDGLKDGLPKTAPLQEMEKTFEKERAAMEEYYAKEVSALGQRLSSEKEQLEEELKRSHLQELQSLREDAEEELAAKLAQIASQYTEYCQSLIQQHLNEKNELLQKHELEKKVLIQDHMNEITQWQEKERALIALWKNDQTNLEEKQNKEQTGICKSFANEKEMLESYYRDHINRLNHEIDGLNALVVKAKNSKLIKKKEQQSLVKRHCEHCTSESEGRQLFPLQAGSVENKYQMMGNTSDKPQDQCVWRQSHSTALHAQHKPVLSALEVLEGAPSLKQEQENALVALQEMESLVASLRAQLHEETKAQETLRMHHKRQILPSDQSKKREDKGLSSGDKSKDLDFQSLESSAHVKNLETALLMLGREKEELGKQVAVLAGHIGLEYNVMREIGIEQELGAHCTPTGACHSLNRNLQGFGDEQPPLCQQMTNKDDLLNLLHGHLREAMSQCQQMEQLAARQIQEATDQLEREKDQVKYQLFELEDLVRRLEKETMSSQDDRMELIRLSEDNTFLRNKAERLQKEIFNLDDSNKKYRTQLEDLRKETEHLNCKLEQLSKQCQEYQNELSESTVRHEESVHHLNTKLLEVTEHKDKANVILEQMQGRIAALETERHNQEMVWKREREELDQEVQKTKLENEKYWDELCQLNTQSLQFTSALSDLTAQREGSYETIQQMNVRLREVIEEKHQASVLVEQLQGKLNENLKNESGWQKEKEQLKNELQMSKDESLKTHNELCKLTCTVSQLTMQKKEDQENMQQLENHLKEATIQKEEDAAITEELRKQLHLTEREKTDWCRAREHLEQDLKISKAKMEALLLQHKQEKQDLLHGLDESNKQLLAVAALQEEVSSLKQVKQSLEIQCHSLTGLLKEANEKVSQAEELKCELKEAKEEFDTLMRTQDELRAELGASQDQLLEANSKLTLAQSQQMREVQQWKEKMSSSVPKEQLSHLQSRLAEEQQKVQQLQERLRFHAEQTNRQLAMQQEEHERLLRRMEERMQEVEMNLRNVRVMLQEKVDQLKEQLEKNAKSDILLKDLYVENAQLMKALQVTEHRQKSAEKKNYLLEEKITALNKVIKKIAPASLAV